MSDVVARNEDRRRPAAWLPVVGLIGVVTAVVLGRPLLETTQTVVRPAPVAAAPAPPMLRLPPAPPPPTPEQITRPHLLRAEQAAEDAIAEHVKAIDLFFGDAKKNTRGFADDALGWSSKWRLASDYVPFSRGDRHQAFIRQKFGERIFTPAQLEAVVKQVVKSYLAQLRSIESKMLVDIRADVADFPSTYPLAEFDDRKLQASYDQALTAAITAAGSGLKADIATQVVSIIAGEVLTQVAVRMGVSAGILTTGAASGWATFGIGAAVGLLVDQIVSYVWDWYADPRGDLAANLNKKLSQMNRLLVDGSGDVQGMRERLRQFGRERSKIRQSAVLSLLEPHWKTSRGGQQ